jgi:hypothetical protein
VYHSCSRPLPECVSCGVETDLDEEGRPLCADCRDARFSSPSAMAGAHEGIDLFES